MSSVPDPVEKSLPPPWDRIFSLGTRTFVWALLIGVLYILQPFLLLIFLTFVFAYIQAHGVDGLAHRIKSRGLRVTIVGLVFLGTLLATGFTLLPNVKDQADAVIENRDRYIADADRELNKFLKQYPGVYEALVARSAALSDDEAPPTRPPHVEPMPPHVDEPPPGEERKPPADGTPRSTTLQGPPKELHAIRDLVSKATASLADKPIEIGQSVLGYASSFLLSLLFSFLIVLDLPKISRGIRGLATTRVGFIYEEVADNIAGFGRVLGRALEAQLLIAVCNTILTAIGIWMMGLPNLLVLSAIVFFCSFIPVVGTFLSSTPICLLALQSGGVGTMVLAIGLISLIHAVETYVLNPQIYGHHMHMNPVLVLIVLTIGGKLFGVWGLVLGIPVVNYVFRHAIRRPEERPAEA
ncbi:MAG: AI-2E family transporter [Planctomycetes bacterium]|nr:AI-2E family transporter [Planctomycetota bacterium]